MKEKKTERNDKDIIDVVKSLLLKRKIEIYGIPKNKGFFRSILGFLFKNREVEAYINIDNDNVVYDITLCVDDDLLISIGRDSRGEININDCYYSLSTKESKKLWNILSKDFGLADGEKIRKSQKDLLIKKIEGI